MIFKHPELLTTCTACGACYNICPHNSISFRENDEGFNFPIIDENTCTECGLCDKVCPIINTESPKERVIERTTYYGWHLDNKIRGKSTSGGIFSALAEQILYENGVVYGALYDYKNRIVKHASTKKFDYRLFRKSKYVQSFIGKTFTDIKCELKNNKKVLFSGTPCQVDGLLYYLGKTYDNLITCDFICHGVPPMKLLNNHLDYLEKKYNDEIIKFDFRSKKRGWSQFHYEIIFKKNDNLVVPSKKDAFHKAFAKNLSLRKSCYKCIYSNKTHPSDITIADFGSHKILNPNLNDEKGLSMIMVNSEKGRDLFRNINNLNVVAIDNKFSDYAYESHGQDVYNLDIRDDFFSSNKKNGWKKTIKRFHLERDPIQLIIKNKSREFVKIFLGPTIVSKIKQKISN